LVSIRGYVASTTLQIGCAVICRENDRLILRKLDHAHEIGGLAAGPGLETRSNNNWMLFHQPVNSAAWQLKLIRSSAKLHNKTTAAIEPTMKLASIANHERTRIKILTCYRNNKLEAGHRRLLLRPNIDRRCAHSLLNIAVVDPANDVPHRHRKSVLYLTTEENDERNQSPCGRF
jgi:hypothetical protein